MINEELILGYLLINPNLLRDLDIDIDFFKNQENKLIFREIVDGNTDLAILTERLRGKVNATYISSLTDGIPKTNARNLSLYIKKVKEKRLCSEINKLLLEGIRKGDLSLVDNEKIREHYEEIDRLNVESENSVLINLNEVKPKPIEWFWYNRIPADKLSLIVGDPGAGKSILSIWMASIISRGKDWPDVKSSNISNIGSVIIASAEDGLADTIRVRADAMGSDVSKIKILKNIIPYSNQGEIFDIRKHLQILEQEIKKIEDIKLLIIDPITAYLGDLQENRNNQVRVALTPLSDLADKYKITVIGITHLNKDQAKKAIYRAMGSIAFIATARSVWLVQLDEDDPEEKRRFFSPLKANLCMNPKTLAFRIEGPLGEPRVIFETDPVDKTARELLADEETRKNNSALKEAKKFLREKLKDNNLLATEILNEAENLGISKRTLDRAKSSLGVRSYQENRQWYWSLRDEN